MEKEEEVEEEVEEEEGEEKSKVKRVIHKRRKVTEAREIPQTPSVLWDISPFCPDPSSKAFSTLSSPSLPIPQFTSAPCIPVHLRAHANPLVADPSRRRLAPPLCVCWPVLETAFHCNPSTAQTFHSNSRDQG